VGELWSVSSRRQWARLVIVGGPSGCSLQQMFTLMCSSQQVRTKHESDRFGQPSAAGGYIFFAQLVSLVIFFCPLQFFVLPQVLDFDS